MYATKNFFFIKLIYKPIKRIGGGVIVSEKVYKRPFLSRVLSPDTKGSVKSRIDRYERLAERERVRAKAYEAKSRRIRAKTELTRARRARFNQVFSGFVPKPRTTRRRRKQRGWYW
jgi:hypothetical protein